MAKNTHNMCWRLQQIQGGWGGWLDLRCGCRNQLVISVTPSWVYSNKKCHSLVNKDSNQTQQSVLDTRTRTDLSVTKSSWNSSKNWKQIHVYLETNASNIFHVFFFRDSRKQFHQKQKKTQKQRCFFVNCKTLPFHHWFTKTSASRWHWKPWRLLGTWLWKLREEEAEVNISATSWHTSGVLAVL